MRVGLYKVVHVKTPTSQRIRTVLTARQLLRAKLLDLENEVRGFLRNLGYDLGKVTARDFERRVRELAGDTDLMIVVEPLLVVRRTLRDGFAQLDDLLVRLAREDAVCRRFMTVPGVGPLVALTFRATVDVRLASLARAPSERTSDSRLASTSPARSIEWAGSQNGATR